MGILSLLAFITSLFCCTKCIQKCNEEPETSYVSVALFNTNELTESMSSDDLPPKYEDI